MSIYRSDAGNLILVPSCFTPSMAAVRQFGEMALSGGIHPTMAETGCGIARRVDCDINSRGFAEVSEHELVVLGTHASQLRL